ncbi:MAG: citrate/2-methylcitrate synthase [Anaerolineales bacterium]|jgi:citrate synthase
MSNYSEEIKLVARPGEIAFSKGLEGVVVAESTKSFVDGLGGKLVYHGHPIEELAERSTFEEVFYLLMHDRLPKRGELEEFSRLLERQRELPAPVSALVEELAGRPGIHPMTVLRTAVSMLAAFDEEAEEDSPAADHTHAIQIVSRMASLSAAISRVRQHKPILRPRRDLSHAANYYYMLLGTPPDSFMSRLMDVLLILHADHECNASTFATIVVKSTLADTYSAVVAGIGALKGPLHGGANERVMEMLEEIGSSENVEAWLDRAMAQKKRIMGFGHRVYKTTDPRATILHAYAREVTRRAGTGRWLDIADKMAKLMVEKFGQKGIYPNIDFFSGVVMASMGIETAMFTPTFAVGRSAGWVAHALEQRQDNRLFRPRFVYVGPESEPYLDTSERS